jgi:hypothetical protein
MAAFLDPETHKLMTKDECAMVEKDLRRIYPDRSRARRTNQQVVSLIDEDSVALNKNDIADFVKKFGERTTLIQKETATHNIDDELKLFYSKINENQSVCFIIN